MSDTSGLILVTGSNGRIGSAVMKRLTGKYGQVIGFDQKAPTPPPPDCVRIAVDTSSDNSLNESLKMLRAHHGSKIPSVIHLAATTIFWVNQIRNMRKLLSKVPSDYCVRCRMALRSSSSFSPAPCWCMHPISRARC